MKKGKFFDPADIPQHHPEQPVSNLMYLIWSIRKDLRKAYDIYEPRGQQGFLNWYNISASREYGLNTKQKTDVSNKVTPLPSRLLQGVWRKLMGLVPTWLKNQLKRIVLRVISSRIHGGKPEGGSGHLNISDPGVDPGANLIGYAFTESGMGEHVRMSAASFSTTDIPFHVMDFNFGVQSRQLASLDYGVIGKENIHQVNIFHINADQILNVITQKGVGFFRNRYNICYPFWELSQFPKEWVPALKLMDEIWAPTLFIQQAISEAMRTEVHHMPIAVTLPPFEVKVRADFGLPEDHYIFFSSFDFLSYIHRKNPWAAVNAFRQAFPEKDAQVKLLIKVMNARIEDPEWKKLERIAEEDSRILLMNRTMSKQELLALKNVCDSYVSLHRAEGFGLGPVEAMLLEKPVIVTNYSGNTDYAHASHACLVDYQIIPIGENQYPFGRGKVWADPSLEHAALHMKKLYENPEWGKDLGQKARAYILENHSPGQCGNNYKKRFKDLGIV